MRICLRISPLSGSLVNSHNTRTSFALMAFCVRIGPMPRVSEEIKLAYLCTEICGQIPTDLIACARSLNIAVLWLATLEKMGRLSVYVAYATVNL